MSTVVRHFRLRDQGPNLLVVLRLLLGPLAGACLLAHGAPRLAALALGLYTLGWITDAIDGPWARWTHRESAFGRAMDSVADKTLMLGFLVGLVAAGRVPEWGVSFFVFRELVLTGLRTIHLPSGQACPVNATWGRAREALTKVVLSSIGLELCLAGYGLGGPGAPAWQVWNRWAFLSVVAVSLWTLLGYLAADLGRLREAMSVPPRPARDRPIL